MGILDAEHRKSMVAGEAFATMNKPTDRSNRAFWENAAKGGDAGRFGVHSDLNITELESWFTIKYAMKPKPNYLLDVGCGKGERTKELSRLVTVETLGIDYSEGMVKLAKRLETEHLRFRVADVLKEPDIGFRPDIIVSCRCLINLQTEKNVRKAIAYFDGLLASGGRLVLLEASKQGHEGLNQLRARLGLGEVKTAWYNINLDEEAVEGQLAEHFDIVEKSRFGLYYLLTRGIYPASIQPKEPDPSSEVNHVAKELQIEAGAGAAERYGRHYCVVFEKR